MEEILAAVETRGDSRIQAFFIWKKKNAKLAWTGGAGVLSLVVLLTFAIFTSTSGSTPSTSVADAKQVAAPSVQTTPVALQPSSNRDGTATWIPVYPGSTPEVISSVQTPDGDQRVSTFKTDDAPGKVVSYFQDQLNASGFNIKTASSGEESGTLQAEDGLKKRSLIMNVNTSADEKVASVRLVTAERK